jgi:predicted Co/Zn/Cd cation transporter (cation efflux family)
MVGLIGAGAGLVVFVLWINGNIVGRVIVWPFISVAVIIMGDDEFGRLVDPHSGPLPATLWIIGCAIVAWIIASLPAILIALLTRQVVVQKKQARNAPADTRWASQWISSHK